MLSGDILLFVCLFVCSILQNPLCKENDFPENPTQRNILQVYYERKGLCLCYLIAVTWPRRFMLLLCSVSTYSSSPRRHSAEARAESDLHKVSSLRTFVFYVCLCVTWCLCGSYKCLTAVNLPQSCHVGQLNIITSCLIAVSLFVSGCFWIHRVSFDVTAAGCFSTRVNESKIKIRSPHLQIFTRLVRVTVSQQEQWGWGKTSDHAAFQRALLQQGCSAGRIYTDLECPQPPGYIGL